MGASGSVTSNINKDWMAIFNAMQFTNAEISVFYEMFVTVDSDHSGSIEIAELLDFLQIEGSMFTERIFSAFDKDGTGKIDFFEFVVSLWKFCALGKESICKSRKRIAIVITIHLILNTVLFFFLIQPCLLLTCMTRIVTER